MKRIVFKDKHGHILEPVSFRRNNQSTIRIKNILYCEKCKKFKKEPKFNFGVMRVN